MEFNGTASEGEWTQMRVAHVKAWSTNLTDTELLQEQNAIRPQKLDNLVGWWPLFPGSGERVKDYSGLGRDWTEGGTLTADAPLAAVEHGLFTTSGTGSGTLLDRSVFTVINLAAGDSLQATYAITFTAGG
jgi:hypothetical protein